jgi:hypothetical protein
MPIKQNRRSNIETAIVEESMKNLKLDQQIGYHHQAIQGNKISSPR